MTGVAGFREEVALQSRISAEQVVAPDAGHQGKPQGSADPMRALNRGGGTGKIIESLQKDGRQRIKI